MKAIKTDFPDLLILEPKVFGDSRGYFFESYNIHTFESVGISANFIQDNESYSKYGTLRGLHFQKGAAAQAKLVRVVKGRVLDVVVDLRPTSPTFKRHFSVELSEENKRQFFVPRGFAHGFVVLSEDAIFQYKCDNFYDPSSEGGIAYDDSSLKIDWKISNTELVLSDKDKLHPTLSEYLSGL